MGNFYVSLRDKNMIIKIDSKRKVITEKWTTNKCREPTSLAVNQIQKKIYIGCRGKDPVLAVMSYQTGKIEQQVEIERGVDGVVYDEKNKRINKKIALFYPKQFYDNTFTVLTYSNKR